MPHSAVSLSTDALDQLMPMHIGVSATGHIRHVAPTLAKVVGRNLVGERFLETFQLRRPRNVLSVSELPSGRRGMLTLHLRHGAPLQMKGLALRTADGGVLINLSFGIYVVEAIGLHGLVGADFAATDLSVEMMFLAEARSAVTVEAMKLNDRLDSARQVAEAMARSDSLTGLANRRAFDEALARLLHRRTPFALMHIDLDYFKEVNDAMGHAAGDAVLVEVGRLLRASIRGDDFAARIGGDEFMLLCAGTTETSRLTGMAWRIITSLERPIPFGGRACRISASIGITTTAQQTPPDADLLLKQADAELYASKRAGRAAVSLHGLGLQPRPPTPHRSRG